MNKELIEAYEIILKHFEKEERILFSMRELALPTIRKALQKAKEEENHFKIEQDYSNSNINITFPNCDFWIQLHTECGDVIVYDKDSNDITPILDQQPNNKPELSDEEIIRNFINNKKLPRYCVAISKDGTVLILTELFQDLLEEYSKQTRVSISDEEIIREGRYRALETEDMIAKGVVQIFELGAKWMREQLNK